MCINFSLFIKFNVCVEGKDNAEWPIGDQFIVDQKNPANMNIIKNVLAEFTLQCTNDTTWLYIIYIIYMHYKIIITTWDKCTKELKLHCEWLSCK